MNEQLLEKDMGEHVLEREGQAFAYNGILHDFMMLNPLRSSAAATAAIEQSVRVLRAALGTR